MHPGGPFWAKKDKGVWSIPKGEIEGNEDPFGVACREFKEETGFGVPQAEPLELGEVMMKSGKKILAWAIEGNINTMKTKSNTFEMKWPPRSGKLQMFPEVDKAAWFGLAVAKEKLNPAQADFIDHLAKVLNRSSLPGIPEQSSLF